MKHINHAIVAKTHPSMYLMHKYWARKPHNVVGKYIEKYSDEGEIVFDPFCGSGVTPIEAVRRGRKALAIDLDPMATFITKSQAIFVDLDEFKKRFEYIEKRCRKKIHELYKTQCAICGKSAIATHIKWSEVTRCNSCSPSIEVAAHEAVTRGKYRYCPNCQKRIDFSSSEKEIPTEIWYVCEMCLKKKDTRIQHLEKKPDDKDLKKLSKIEKMKIPFWYPNNQFIWNSRINISRGTKVSDLFTRRNLIALSIIYNEIEKLSGNIKELMLFTFSSSLAQASKLIPIVHGGRECKSWTVRGYWVPPKRFEINAWNCFYNRFLKILRGKKESNIVVGARIEEAKEFDDFLLSQNFLLLTQSATMMNNIPSNSVDYVFTDPPYGDSVPYLELDFMWSAWLRLKPNFRDEIIISDSPERQKGFDEYYALLVQSFKEVFRILKPGKWMTVTFHSTDINIYNSILRAVIFAGFELEKIVYQPPARASAKSLLHPYGSAVGDYYIRFKKPLIQRKLFTEKEIDKIRFEKIVIETIKKIIAERGEPTTYTDILKGIYVQLDKHGYLLVSKPENIKRILKKQEGEIFVFVKDQGWWFKDPSKYWLHIIPLQDRVETAVVQTLKRKYKVSFDEILQEIFEKFENALTPNPPSITTILHEYAERTKDKKWRLSPKVNQREKEHSVMIGHLAELGHKAGFNVWIGLREQGDVYEGKALSSLSEDRLELQLPPDVLDRLKMIDVIWFKDGKIEYAFEVEHTTSITSAIARGSYIPKDDVNRFMVIPEEREVFMYKKINAPIFKDRIDDYNWAFIFYKDLATLYKAYRKKSQMDIAEIESYSRELVLREPDQKLLSDFANE